MARLDLAVEVEVKGARELEDVSESLEGVTDGLGDVAKDLDDAGASVGHIGDEMEDAAEQVDTADRKVQNLRSTFFGLGEVVDGIGDSISGIGDIASGDLSGILDLAKGLGDITFGVVEGVIPAIQLIKDGALQAAATMVASVGTQVAAWATLSTQSMIHAVRVAAAWALAFAPVLLVIGAFVLVGAAIAALVAVVVLNWDAIVLRFQHAVEEISSTMQAIGDVIGAVWDAIIGVFDEAAKAIHGIGRRIFRPISEGFDAAIKVIKGIWNAFVRFWNGIQISVPAVNIPIVGRVGGFTIGLPDLPFLAEGGIINDPTLAVLGEKGPEAVIPLDQMPEGGITFNFNGPITGDQRELPGLMLRTLYVAQVGN